MTTPRPTATEMAMAALKRSQRAQANADAEEAAKTAQRAAEAAVVPVADDPEPRGLEHRASACRLCGVTVLPGTGESFSVERWRKVPGGKESFLTPHWKMCQRCCDVGGSMITWADWLNIEHPDLGALHDLSREYPQLDRKVEMGSQSDATAEFYTVTGDLGVGPQRYEFETGARAGDVGYPKPWMHPGAKRGRPGAKARFAELRMLWSEDGRRHESLASCGICGRSHALRPVANPPAGWKDSTANARWTDVKIMNGLLACSICATAYRQCASGGGPKEWTLEDWAASQASGCYPHPGLAAQVGDVLARHAPAVPVGEERGPWEHVGEAALVGLAAWARKAGEGKPATPPVLDQLRRSGAIS